MSTPTNRMSPKPTTSRANVVGLQERRLGRNVLRTYRTNLDIDEIVPNDHQPRSGPKEDVELQRQIVANQGVFEPLLVEPHPEFEEKFRIIDGDRRWTNTRVLVIEADRSDLRSLPVEVTDRTLSDEERLRVWIYIHRQRKEWDAREKEMVAYRLVELLGRASAASILGVTVRELDKLVHVFELSKRFTDLQEPGASITWARELNGVAKKLLTPEVVDAVVDKVNSKRITNSKDLRKLRQVLRDPVAKQHFMTASGDIDSAVLRIAPPEPESKGGLAGDIDALTALVKQYPWTELSELKGDPELLEKITEAQTLLDGLKDALKP
ncbi:MAG: ParB N-terminal domain-containing protein [Gammaproteobacteria bacterium]|nr:ParB N-terminal domain-containing protein [Gammaproteobacteria bacterium]